LFRYFVCFVLFVVNEKNQINHINHFIGERAIFYNSSRLRRGILRGATRSF
jgi:hypothetical protein